VNRILLLLILAIALPASAAEGGLSARLAPGKWALAYQRIGELKPLHFKHEETGTSYTCIEGDPRAKIVDWIKSKGCTIDKETMDGEVYRMSGECRLKWWKSAPIPVSVELRPENRKAFTLEIRTEGNSILNFTEHTRATHQGACDPQTAPPAAAPQSISDPEDAPANRT
jgi:hypothetical protein